MDAKVTWDQGLVFTGVAESGFPVRMSSPSGPDLGVGPVEMTAMALAACTAMDVVSILQKKQERVQAFHVSVHAERATSYPKIITSAILEYVVTGRGIREASLRRAIELSVRQYCPVHAMLSKAFPIELKYIILEGDDESTTRLVLSGRCEPDTTENTGDDA
ncbi:MAG TPA: OsmC family protein [Anaerolineales bacterium]|nr:OsmC family protein [Anaerolineales bacterium]